MNDTEKKDTRIIKESDLRPAENYRGIKTCEEGRELAQEDLEKGRIKYIFGGFGSRQELPRKLEQLYDIEIIKVDGVLGLQNDCYNKLMYKEIQRRFGEDAFNRAVE